MGDRAFLVLVIAACGGGGGGPDAQAPDGGTADAASPDAACTRVWSQRAADPAFPFQSFGGVIWNDPSVLREGGTYRMWLSNGAGAAGVQIHEARSTDGDTWTLSSSIDAPQLAGGPSAFDQHATETPAVVKLGATYHMFYTAVPDDTLLHYSVGHATSLDGETWTKDLQPAIPRPTTPNDWGWLGVAEPGATVKDGTIYLYYAMIRCRDGLGPSGCTGSPMAARGIGLATSTDGVVFTPDPGNPVLIQTPSHPATDDYEGYSTPSAITIDGTIHLFYDVVRNEGGFRQVALSHSVSTDGRAFTEVEPDFLMRDPDGWTAYEMRSPTAVESDGELDVWFAGHSRATATEPGFETGIGHAWSTTSCL